MQKTAIKLSLLIMLVFAAVPTMAQEITSIRAINDIPADQVATLQAGGASLTADVIETNIFNELNGTEVTIVAVILTDPRNSGLSNLDNDGRVNRVHMFVRDTSAVTQGNDGMAIQVVDGAYDTNNLLNLNIGDVIKITGAVSPFNTAMQVSPTTVELLGSYVDLGLPDSILDPVVITTDFANQAVGAGDGVQVNWENLAALRNQFVRIEGVRVLTRNFNTPSRPDFYVTSDDGSTVLNFYDTSIRFRNDRSDYPDEFNKRTPEEGDFAPPPPGSIIDLQGVLVFQSGADQIGRGVPSSGLLSIVPFEDRGCDDENANLRCDLVVLESPPIVSDVIGPDFVPDGSEAVVIDFQAQAGPSRSLTDTFCEYFTSEDATVQTVAATQSGDNLACSIPPQNDGVFVTYQTGATDDAGDTVLSEPASYRTLADGINEIEDIQLTIDGGPGNSPFTGLTTAMDITAIVASDPATSGLITLQDDAGLAGWTGIFLSENESQLQQGDEIQITTAEIFESFGVTTLGSAQYTVLSSGNTVDYKTVPTTALADASVAEAHEGMLIRFDDVTTGPNPDAPRDFGEWSFATTGTSDFLRADDASAAIPSDFNALLAEGNRLGFIRGIWWFSFGNYKLVPENPDTDVSEFNVTIRTINSIPSGQIAALNAGGDALTQDVIDANIFNNNVVGKEVTFVAVVLTDPRNSGLSNLDNDGRVNRVHMFVRDTSAVTQGNDGMAIQVVDGAYDTNNLLNLNIGDVIKITGAVSPFNTAMQVSPTTVELLGSYVDLGLPDSILDPVVITTDFANQAVGAGDGVQVNWENLAALRNQFVRIEGVRVLTRNFNTPSRPDFYVTSDDGSTVLNFYDTSIRFRNDRSDYPDEFNKRTPEEGDFAPPPPGSIIDLQGVLVFQSGADQIGRGVPSSGLLSIVPFEDRGCDDENANLRCDLVVLESPPIVSDVIGPDFVPDGSEAVVIDFQAQAGPSRSLTDTFCEYFTSEDATVQTVAATQSGDNLACSIPPQNDGVFVTYQTGATDDAGDTVLSEPASYRTLADGINEIEDIQLTIDGGPGNSPFTGLTTAMDITAIVASDPATSGLITLQDDAGLAGWTGIFLSENESQLQQGDEIQITTAEIFESFGVTTLGSAQYTVLSSGNTVDYKVVTTTVLTDASVAEAHEGMLVGFENVVTGANPDAPRDFGEWSFATQGTEDFLRADDASDAIESTFNATLGEGTTIDRIQGVWWFSFGNYKLVPESTADVIGFVGTATEDDAVPNDFALNQNYPNPFNPTTTISYQLPASGDVRLEVFDMLGRSVSLLVDGVVNAGTHTVEFNAANLPSGVYLYRLHAGEKVSTKKMMLLK